MPRFQLSYYAEDNQVRVFRASSVSVIVGSDSSCDLCLPGLAPAHAKIFSSVEGYYVHELGGDVLVNNRPGSGFVKDGDAIQLGDAVAIRFQLTEDGPAAPAASPQRSPSAARREQVHETRIRPGARRHRPGVALLLSIFLPGAGQAYNGQPVLGFLVLVSSVLALPWLIGMAAAWSRAKKLAAAGGRVGRGGTAWVLLHSWAALNVALTVVIGLTMAGVTP